MVDEPVPEQPLDPAARVAELEAQLLRAFADLANVRKRAARQADEARAQERAAVAASWLPVLDNLDRAVAHAQSDPTIASGLHAVRDQALAVLERLGYPRRSDLGTPFDPAVHEAVGAVDATGGAVPGTVVDVVRPGYGDGDRQLRPAAVVVARERDGRED